MAADSCPCVAEAANRVTSTCWNQRRCGAVGAQFRWRLRAWVRAAQANATRTKRDGRNDCGRRNDDAGHPCKSPPHANLHCTCVESEVEGAEAAWASTYPAYGAIIGPPGPIIIMWCASGMACGCPKNGVDSAAATCAAACICHRSAFPPAEHIRSDWSGVGEVTSAPRCVKEKVCQRKEHALAPPPWLVSRSPSECRFTTTQCLPVLLRQHQRKDPPLARGWFETAFFHQPCEPTRSAVSVQAGE